MIKLPLFHRSSGGRGRKTSAGPAAFLDHVGRLGRGLAAARSIRQGEPILEFAGNQITFAEAVAKGKFESYALQFGKDAYLDLRRPGCFVNHSCDPNCAVRGVPEGRERTRGRSYELVAKRNIAPGDELLFDYSTTMHENYWTLECRCGAPSCRGVVRDFITLPVSLQRAYLAAGDVMPFIADELSWETVRQPQRSGGSGRVTVALSAVE